MTWTFMSCFLCLPEQVCGCRLAVPSGCAGVSEVVQPRKTPLHDPPAGAQSGTAACDRRYDAAGADLVAAEVVVVDTVGEQ